MGPIRLPPSNGIFAQRRSRAKGARCCSSRPTAKFLPRGRNWPRTSSVTNISTVKWALRNVRRACVSWSTAFAGPSPTGALPTAISSTRPMGSGSTASCAGCVCTSLPRSIRRSGSTWACTISTASKGQCATGIGIRRLATPSNRRIPTNIPRHRLASSKACKTTWKISWSSHVARPCCSSSAQAPAPTFPRCVPNAKSYRAAENPRGRCRSCGCTTKSRLSSKAAARRAGPPKCSRSKTGIPTFWNSLSARIARRRRSARWSSRATIPKKPTTRYCSKTPIFRSA